MPLPYTPAPNVGALFAKSQPQLMAQDGLRCEGGVVSLQSSQPVVARRAPEEVASTAFSFQITSGGKVLPGLVGDEMPTLGGEPLNATDHVLDLTQDGDFVYFKITFAVTYVEGYLASWRLNSVSVEQGSVPTDTPTVKYLVFNSIAGGAAYGPSYFIQSINVRLVDNGLSDTRMLYNNFY